LSHVSLYPGDGIRRRDALYRLCLKGIFVKNDSSEPLVTLAKFLLEISEVFKHQNNPVTALLTSESRIRACVQVELLTGQVLGKTGTVVAVDSDGDLKVDFGGKMWILNPQCCIPVSQGQGQVPSARASLMVNTESSDDDDDDNSQY